VSYSYNHWRPIEQQIQLIGTKKIEQIEGKTGSDWPENDEDKLESGQRTLEIS
jgi:hypothetical protein